MSAPALGGNWPCHSDHAKAEKSIGETELQITQTKQKFQEDTSRDLVDTREKLRDLRNKFVVARDAFRRLDVEAPVTGRVQNLKVFTVGAVARQGEPLLEIAPDQDRLVVQAHVSTLDIEGVRIGNAAEVRFPAFHDRTMPMIGGEGLKHLAGPLDGRDDKTTVLFGAR